MWNYEFEKIHGFKREQTLAPSIELLLLNRKLEISPKLALNKHIRYLLET